MTIRQDLVHIAADRLNRENRLGSGQKCAKMVAVWRALPNDRVFETLFSRCYMEKGIGVKPRGTKNKLAQPKITRPIPSDT